MPAISRSIVSASRVFLVLALLLALTGVAGAEQKRVLVNDFSGPQGSRARRAVVDAVKKEHKLVPQSKWRDAEEELDATRKTPANIRKVAEATGTDVIIDGKVARKGGKWELQLRLREGKSGKVKRIAVGLRSPRVDTRAERTMVQELMPMIDGMEAVEGPPERVAKKKPKKKGKRAADEEGLAEEEDAPVEDIEEEGEFEEEEEPPPPPKRSKKKVVAKKPPPPVEEEEEEEPETEPVAEEEPPVADAEPEAAEPAVEEDEDTEPGAEEPAVSKSRDTGPPPPGSVSAGLSFSARNMSFTYSAGVTDVPWGYDGNPVPGAYVRLELYPFAFGGKTGALSRVGVEGDFDRVLGLKSQLESGGAKLTTTQQRIRLGLLYRIPFGQSPSSPSAAVRLGYNQLSFAIDSQGTDIDLPNVTYGYANVGASLRLPLGSPRLALVVGGNYLAVLSTGDMEAPQNYGGGSVGGFDGDLAAEYMVSRRLLLRAGVQYMRVAYDFDGTGMKTTNRDASPDQDVGGALDVYFGGFATVGYVF